MIMTGRDIKLMFTLFNSLPLIVNHVEHLISFIPPYKINSLGKADPRKPRNYRNMMDKMKSTIQNI